MNELQTNDKIIATIPSYEVAKMMERRHSDVLRMLEGSKKPKVIGIIPVIEENVELHLSDYFIKSTYKTSQNKEVICYECTQMGCDMLANKMTGEKGILFTAKYVKRFREMTEYINNQVPKLTERDNAILNIINSKDDLTKALAIREFENIVKEPLIEEIENLKELNNKLKTVIGKDGLIDVDTFSKTLNIKELGRNNMYKWLRENKYFMRNNKPYQHYINQGLFKLKSVGYRTNCIGEQIPLFKTYISIKGCGYLLDKLVNQGYIDFVKDFQNN